MCLVVSCSYESGLSGLECDEEGQRSGDRVCQDGYWVDDDGVATDTGDTQGDAESDVADVVTCDPDQRVCGGECVDVTTSSVHCGECDNACEALGAQTVAECAGGTCQRYCAEGFSDDNDDWRENYDEAAGTDGCEASCTPSNGGEEVCDNLDNNCDGRIDEVEKTYYRDGDGDGFGDGDQALVSCSDPPDTYVEQAGDCDDTEASINPEADEDSAAGSCSTADQCDVCNGADVDCDGSIDENCPCDYDDSSTGVCGTARLDGAGECIEPGLYEADETTCDRVDNDCDGEEDEGCGCNYDGQSEGVCFNADIAENGDCIEPAEYTGDEKDDWCDDGLDNDCDGDTDCADANCDRDTCDTDKICVLGSCCDSPTDEDACTDRDFQCGRPTVTDRCGEQREINCGNCGGGASCVANTCVEEDCKNGNDDDDDTFEDCLDPDCDGRDCGGGDVCHQMSCCESPDDSTFCSARDACGLVTDTDRCGITRTDVDCGACLFEPCGSGDDCASGYCNGDVGLCEAAHCDSDSQDADETGTDCGGSECLKCPGDACASDAECHSGNCTGGGECRDS